MKKRLLIIVAILGAGAFLAIGVFLLLQDRPAVTEANCNRIKPGMTEAEVEAIFGEPKAPDGEPLWLDWYGLNGRTPPTWIGSDGMAVVRFDLNGKVIRADWIESPRASLWDRIRLWIGLDSYAKVDGGIGPAN
jgi:hypothetical protein